MVIRGSRVAAVLALLDGSCVEIYLFNPDGAEADTEQQLDELVRLALG